MDAAVRTLLHRRGLAPRAGAGRRLPARPGSADGHGGAARHGLGREAGLCCRSPGAQHGGWSSRAVAHRLLLLLVAVLVPKGPVVVGLDDTIERRWGTKIRARGIYRDPVRSSH